MHIARRAAIVAGVTAGAFGLLATAGGRGWKGGGSQRTPPIRARVGPSPEASDDMQARRLAGPCPVEPPEVWPERREAAPAQLGSGRAAGP